MVILIGGASHTGKTLLAQRLMERYRYPVLSIDLLKMGLIRSGQTELTPEDDDLLTPYLWGIVQEIVKTAIENGQNLIVEGCYIPFDWEDGFDPGYLEQIEYVCLIMSKQYLENHGDNVARFENAIERRVSGEVDVNELIEENERNLASCRQRGLRLYSSIALSTFRYDYFRHFAITCPVSSTIGHFPASMPCPSSCLFR